MISKLRYIVATLFIIIAVSSFDTIKAQKDPEAKKIVDQFVKKSKGFDAIFMKFTINTENHQNKDKTSINGDALLKGDKYKLNINKTVIYNDGKLVYSFLPDEKEVSISNYSSKKEESMLVNPTYLFKIYDKNYKYRLLGETTFNSKNCYEIDFYPNDLNKKYSIVKLIISKEKLNLEALKVKMKSGIDYIIKVQTFEEKKNISDSEFVFDAKAHPDVEVVDLRKKK